MLWPLDCFVASAPRNDGSGAADPIDSGFIGRHLTPRRSRRAPPARRSAKPRFASNRQESYFLPTRTEQAAARPTRSEALDCLILHGSINFVFQKEKSMPSIIDARGRGFPATRPPFLVPVLTGRDSRPIKRTEEKAEPVLGVCDPSHKVISCNRRTFSGRRAPQWNARRHSAALQPLAAEKGKRL
jgi:hypothetical protein